MNSNKYFLIIFLFVLLVLPGCFKRDLPAQQPAISHVKLNPLDLYNITTLTTIDFNTNPPAIGDINGDGNKEIVITSRGTLNIEHADPQKLVVYNSNLEILWERNFTPIPTKIIYHLGPPCLVDLNQDGISEIVFAVVVYSGVNVIGSSVYAINGKGEDVWRWYTIRSVYITTSYDVNNDGRSEIIASGAIRTTLPSKCGIYCLSSDGKLLWSWEGEGMDDEVELLCHLPTTSMSTSNVKIADLNLNGIVEIVIAYNIVDSTEYITGNYLYNYRGIAVLSNDGVLLWNKSTPYRGVIVGDVYGDKKMEIVISGTRQKGDNFNLTILDCDGNVLWRGEEHPFIMTATDIDHNAKDNIIAIVPDKITKGKNGGIDWIDSFSIVNIEDMEVKWQTNISSNLSISTLVISVADFDNNSFPEIIVPMSYGEWSSEATVDGHPMFSRKCEKLVGFNYFGELIWNKTLPGGSVGSSYIAVSDIDNNGALEIVAVKYYDADMWSNDPLYISIFALGEKVFG